MKKILAADGRPLNGEPKKRVVGFAAAYRYPWGEIGYLALCADGSPRLTPSLAEAEKSWVYDGDEQGAVNALSATIDQALGQLPRETYRSLGSGDVAAGEKAAERAALVRILG